MCVMGAEAARNTSRRCCCWGATKGGNAGPWGEYRPKLRAETMRCGDYEAGETRDYTIVRETLFRFCTRRQTKKTATAVDDRPLASRLTARAQRAARRRAARQLRRIPIAPESRPVT